MANIIYDCLEQAKFGFSSRTLFTSQIISLSDLHLTVYKHLFPVAKIRLFTPIYGGILATKAFTIPHP
jgi:hypothetical protein